MTAVLETDAVDAAVESFKRTMGVHLHNYWGLPRDEFDGIVRVAMIGALVAASHSATSGDPS